MKLKKGDYVNIEGVSKEVFDACVAVAVASGFENEISCIKPVYLFIGDEGVFRASDNKHDEVKNKLTINEWLFSLAPDWAETIDTHEDAYFYSNGINYIKAGGEHTYQESDGDNTKTIATRDTVKKDWEPKVGEVVIYKGCDDITVKAVDGFEVWVNLADRGSRIVTLNELKPLPTEEEVLIKVLSDSYTDVTDIVKVDGHFKHYAKALIKAGYKKC